MKNPKIRKLENKLKTNKILHSKNKKSNKNLYREMIA